MDSSFRQYALIWGCSIIYREVSQLIISKLNYIFHFCGSLFHTCSKQCRPWWNASFRLGLRCLPDGTHLCPNSINGSSIIFFEKKYLSAHMITVLITCSYPPKSVLLSIYFHNVCQKLFVGFPWVVTSTGPGGLINCVFILWRELPKA